MQAPGGGGRSQVTRAVHITVGTIMSDTVRLGPVVAKYDVETRDEVQQIDLAWTVQNLLSPAAQSVSDPR